MAKRLFDIIAAALGLVALSPLLLIAALAVKLSSPGPAFFRQERIGRNGVPFDILKFRTMLDGNGPAITLGDDPRITPVGALLRRSKIDELPQLFNVLKGDMSIVGPRPEVPRYVAKWPEDLCRHILSVRPGITDPASIRFRNESEILSRYPDPEAAYETVVMPEKLRLYADYVSTATLMGDLRLILRTLRVL